jgi:parallel beta-helix repeat protein
MHNGQSDPDVTDCTFIGNRAQRGGGTYSDSSNAVFTGCSFAENWADDEGGAMYNFQGSPSLTHCTFSENSADYGGGAMSLSDSDPILTHCQFIENSSHYGGAIHNGGNPSLKNCVFRANVGRDYGGAMYNTYGGFAFTECIFSGNRAGSYGGGLSCNRSDGMLTSCTFSANSAPNGSAIACNSSQQTGQSEITIINSVLWDAGNPIWIIDNSRVDISYSTISGGWQGDGNIADDPLFMDSEGPDGVPNTGDEDLRLSLLSPCVDAGDPCYAPGPDETDFGGDQRIIGGRIDMGAHEFQGLLYVDDDVPDNSERGNLLTYGTEHNPFRTIQEAVDAARDEYTVFVRPGVYGKFDFVGRAITVRGTDGSAVIEASSGDVKEDAVTFHTGEGPDSVLKNFIIRNSAMAISLNSRSSPTISNLTIVDNDFGIAAYEDSNPDISNCIFRNNADGDLFQCEVRYSCIEGGGPGEGNITVDPLFVDPANGDYHLKSEGWRWSVYEQRWTYDGVTSRCIDAGDPASPLADELMSVPRDPDNVYGLNQRINMGAFGGTEQASMAPVGWILPEYETVPPQPNPAQWASDGAPREVPAADGVSGYYARMRAAEATDQSRWVEYFFECITDPAFSSSWQSSPTYSVLIGRSGQGLRFRVKARDLYANETEWSEELAAN